MARDEDDRSVTMARDEDDRSVVMARDEDDSFVAMVRDEDDRSVAMARDKDVAMAIDEDENENESSVAMAIDENDSLAAMAIDPKKLKGLPKEEPLSWFKQPWPIMFFDHNRAYRPIRYIGNSPFTRLGPVRTEVSQYFFGTYSSDGKQRISFTFLPSVLVLGEKLGKYRDLLDTSCSSEDPYHRWIHTMKRRRDFLGNEFSDRVKALSNGSPAENVIERRVEFSNSQGDSFIEMYDPFLNGAFRGTINQLESPRMLNDSIISNLSDFVEVSMKDCKEGYQNDQFGYGYHISHRWQELEHESFRLPWEPLPTDTVRSLVPITKSSERGKVEPISKRLYLLAERIIANQARKKIFEESLSNIDSSNIDSSFGNLIYPKDSLEMTSDQIQEIYAKDDDSLIHFLWLEIAFRVAYIDIVPEIASCNERIYTNYLVNIYNQIDGRNVSPTGTIKWELILDLFTTNTEQKVTSEQIFLFESLAQHEWTILRNFRGNVSTDDSTQTKDFLTLYREILLNEPLQMKEIQKHVPRWSSNVTMDESDDVDTTPITTNSIRARKVRSTLTFDIGDREIVMKRYFVESDYRRNLIKGSIRAQRRKIMIWKRMQPNVHSFFFLVRKEIPTYPKDHYDTSDSDRVNMERIPNEIREQIQRYEEESEPVPHSPTLAESLCTMWPELNYLRGLFLVAQSNLRKSIILPSLIIAKNIGRILLFQGSEFPKDWEQMRREVHIKCAPDGTEYSETEFPDKWKRNGMQIKLLFPFRLKPWHSPELQFEKKLRWSYLTTLGFETDIPFGDPIPQLGPFSEFFQPIFKELIFKKLKRGLIIFQKLIKGLILFKKLKRRLMGSTGIRRVPRVRYIDKSELNDRIQNKLLSETTPMDSANDSSEMNDPFGYETRTINVKDPDDRMTTMKERIKSIAIINSAPITGMSLVDSESNNGSKGSLGSTFKKRLVQIRRIPGRFRKKSVQLIRKRFYSMKLMKLFLKRMDRYLLPSFIHFLESNIKFWIRSAWIRSTGNIAAIYGQIFIINNDISRINRGKITNYYLINEKIQDFEINPDRNMFSMSQAYVFHKIWQIRAMNRSYSKYLLKSRAQTSYPLIKKKIQELLDIQGILDHEKPQDLKENDWKQWLRCFDRYNISPEIWSRINPQNWRNGVSKQCTCYEEQFIPYEQQKDSIFAAVMEPYLGLLRKINKRYRYDLLSYSYLNSTKDFDILNSTKDFDILNSTKDFDILNLTKDFDILNLTKDFDILDSTKDSDILDSTKDSDILDSTKDSDILDSTKDSDILDSTKDSDIYGPPVQPYIPDDHDITDREGILREKFIRDIIEEDWKGTDFNIMNGPRSTIEIYDAIRSCTYDHTTMIDRQKTDLLTNKQRIDETRRDNVGIMDSPEIEKRGSVLDLKLWLFPDLFGIKNIYDTESKYVPKKSFLREERDRKKIEEEEERKETTEQGIGVRSHVHKKKGKEHNRNDKAGKVEDQKTGKVEDQKTGKVEDQKTDEKKKADEKKKTHQVFVQYKAVEGIGEDSIFKLSDVCRVMCGIKDPVQYLWTNIHQGDVNLNLMFLLLQKTSNEKASNEKDSNERDSNEKEIWEENILREDVPRKVSNRNEIWEDKNIVIPEPYRLSSILDDQFLMYKIISISFKFPNKAREWIDENLYDGSVQRGKILGDGKNILSSLNLEDLLLPKRRREFRILNRFDPENDHVGFSNGKDIQNDEELMERDQHLSVDTTQIIKRFLWPSYRLEDLICMNRYWFNTNDGSRSAMLRIRMYPLTFN
uniref:Protein TIC 214 n=1 Tax=Picea mariana TaxID=3335 RepID=A0A7D5Y1C7_PICMA|nr:Ycf1 [Picea mariana]QLJ93365.1 Ycf1 [Picea mariana]